MPSSHLDTTKHGAIIWQHTIPLPQHFSANNTRFWTRNYTKLSKVVAAAAAAVGMPVCAGQGGPRAPSRPSSGCLQLVLSPCTAQPCNAAQGSACMEVASRLAPCQQQHTTQHKRHATCQEDDILPDELEQGRNCSMHPCQPAMHPQQPAHSETSSADALTFLLEANFRKSPCM
jgi:hypothetical protein